jgi:hypothetical protein
VPPNVGVVTFGCPVLAPKQASLAALHMSAFGGKADMTFGGPNVCL